MRLTWEEVSTRRLARHHLTDGDRAGDSAAAAAGALGIHAQVMSAAEVSIGIRTGGVTRAGVRGALWAEAAGCSLVKSRGPRGTVHLLAAADLPMWTGALQAVPSGPSPFAPEVRMTGAQTDQVVAAISDAVAAADAPLTVDELTTAIVERAGPWAGDRVMPAFQDLWPRWRQAEAVAMHRGAMCFGPDRARRATYLSPARRIAGFRPAPADEALAALVTRYLRAYGPATPAHFARWLAASPAWAAGLFTRFAGLIEPVDFDGVEAWVALGDTAFEDCRYGGLRLLPYFDAYLIGCTPRATLFPGRAAERALTNGQAGNVPALLVDGVVAGVWHQRRSGRRIAVTVEPFAPLNGRLLRLLEAEADRVAEILEGRAELTVGPVAVGPHA
ncbi:winged helix DNA-binding domain-containing protein [Actinoplanes sp. NPDC049668]|uniref:winged helix DNA-binding domain-containing protein n=1 Tax=unclassified Actinoplanes TaxID=2626549 RepID=UPI0033A577FD